MPTFYFASIAKSGLDPFGSCELAARFIFRRTIGQGTNSMNGSKRPEPKPRKRRRPSWETPTLEGECGRPSLDVGFRFAGCRSAGRDELSQDHAEGEKPLRTGILFGRRGSHCPSVYPMLVRRLVVGERGPGLSFHPILFSLLTPNISDSSLVQSWQRRSLALPSMKRTWTKSPSGQRLHWVLKCHCESSEFLRLR